ncbi:substrate-binding periplasmic protein [Vibrio ostreicida]|uniref:substrate-binding periplasmic protein n=1 Tax=Vibrio ostreicida TaxID=526588 RepID=UPI003B5AF0EF
MIKLFVLVCLLIISPLSIAQSDDKSVRFVVGDWEPYTSSQRDPELKVAEVLVREAFATQGYSVSIDYHPWSRAYRYGQTGRYDGTFPWFKNSEREELFIFSSPLFIQKIVFFYHQNSQFNWRNIGDLNQFHIGATQDYEVTRLLKTHGVTLDIANTDQSNFIKLGKERIDAYPASVERGSYMLGTLLSATQLNQIEVHPKPIIERAMFLMFSRENSERSKHLNAVLHSGINQLIESGEYQNIIGARDKQITHSHPTLAPTATPASQP